MRFLFEKSTHDSTAASARETLTVMASSSGSAPTSPPKVALTWRILGKMSSPHTWSGAPLEAHASMYSSRYRRERFETGPRDALIRYDFLPTTGNSSR